MIPSRTELSSFAEDIHSLQMHSDSGAMLCMRSRALSLSAPRHHSSQTFYFQRQLQVCARGGCRRPPEATHYGLTHYGNARRLAESRGGSSSPERLTEATRLLAILEEELELGLFSELSSLLKLGIVPRHFPAAPLTPGFRWRRRSPFLPSPTYC